MGKTGVQVRVALFTLLRASACEVVEGVVAILRPTPTAVSSWCPLSGGALDGVVYGRALGAVVDGANLCDELLLTPTISSIEYFLRTSPQTKEDRLRSVHMAADVLLTTQNGTKLESTYKQTCVLYYIKIRVSEALSKQHIGFSTERPSSTCRHSCSGFESTLRITQRLHVGT